MRLDLYLTQTFNIQSRNKALELIKSDKVKIDGAIISKPSFNVEQNHKVEILEDDFYVSRAAYKLKYFLQELKHFELKNKNAPAIETVLLFKLSTMERAYPNAWGCFTALH